MDNTFIREHQLNNGTELELHQLSIGDVGKILMLISKAKVLRFMISKTMKCVTCAVPLQGTDLFQCDVTCLVTPTMHCSVNKYR